MNPCPDIVIRSHANPTVRHLVRLRSNRTRRKEKRLLVDGWRETGQAIEAGLELVRLVVPESVEDPKSDATLIERAAAEQKLTRVCHAVMEKISYGDNSRGVVGEFLEPRKTLGDLQLSNTPLVLVLDCLEKPGNIGAVFRSADAAGVDAVILCGGGSDVYNPNAIRSSLGTVFSIPNVSASEADTIAFCSERGIQVVAARVESSTELWSTDLTGPLAIVLGSEADGLGKHFSIVDKKATSAVRIPMLGAVDSLNVSVSAAVILYEAQRQRLSISRAK
ncbi:23S rRNA (guanosine-2'-O-)-methyltransferase RlmB [Novipirellula aureliae]|uniref:23S rRNA (Guanosine-2'-O-)-methyltransferase RlmB n=1 Tax=Novipirellula aureliae TaxID=2527966 RepID=A0A5C6DX62_9BACT|nr:RNA methyltransferase [Novipirellula aureliae]TWU41330.1 23S rRNA (guanosine-2'-O-)-methyltransferase RlmB [Novipirellula aureliae]